MTGPLLVSDADVLRADLNGDELRMYRHVATMQRDLAYEPPADGAPDWAAGAEAARERGIMRLADRLAERATA
jgi:hypothetical protein